HVVNQSKPMRGHLRFLLLAHRRDLGPNILNCLGNELQISCFHAKWWHTSTKIAKLLDLQSRLCTHLPPLNFFRYTAPHTIGADMKKVRMSGWRGVVLSVLVFAGSIQCTWAQVTAAISGKVEDASGAAVGGAMVTVKSIESGAVRTVTTDETGNYRALSLPLGPQEVRAEKAGFRAALRTGINLIVGQEAIVDLKLDVGQVSQEVTVAAETALVDLTTASVAGFVGEREIKELPLNGRGFDNLITLNPGSINYTYKSPGTVTSQGNTFS